MSAGSVDRIAKLDKIPIQSHPTLKDFEDFIKSVNQDIVELNTLIEKYNQANISKKQDALIQIDAYRLMMNNKYSLGHIAECKSYQDQIHQKLYDTIQEKLKKHSEEEISGDHTTQLTTLIRTMSHNHLSEYMSDLWKNSKDHSKSLMETLEPFYRTHECRPLNKGMERNSRNILVSAKDRAHTSYIFKFESRLGQPRSPEMKLREAKAPYLAKIYGEMRQGTFVAPVGKRMAGNFIVTDFFEKGDLKTKAQKDSSLTTAEKQAHACELYLKMADVMQDMRKKKVAFPDAKNTNWLIDEKDNLIISDTKSFAHVSEDGTLDYKSQDNKWIAPASSKGFTPTEFSDFSMAFSVDKMSSYMLGKNMYQYLTNCDENALEKLDVNNHDEQYFGAEVFKGEIGHVFKVLIQHCLQDNPTDRPTLDSVQKTLKNKTLQAIDLEKERSKCKNLLHEMQLKALPYDQKMQDLLQKYHANLSDKDLSLEQIQGLRDEIIKSNENLNSVQQNFDKLKKYLSDLVPDESIKKAFAGLNLNQYQPLGYYNALINFYNNELNNTKIQCEIKFEELKKLCKEHVEDQYFADILAKLNNPSMDLKALVALKSELTKCVDITNEVSSTIRHFENTWFLYKDADTKKAKEIKEAFLAIPLKDRAHIFDIDKKQDPCIISFKKALATHRIGSVEQKNKAFFDEKTKEINPEKAANTYKKFKEKFAKLIEEKKDKTSATHEGEGKTDVLKK